MFARIARLDSRWATIAKKQAKIRAPDSAQPSSNQWTLRARIQPFRSCQPSQELDTTQSFRQRFTIVARVAFVAAFAKLLAAHLKLLDQFRVMACSLLRAKRVWFVSRPLRPPVGDMLKEFGWQMVRAVFMESPSLVSLSCTRKASSVKMRMKHVHEKRAQEWTVLCVASAIDWMSI